MNHLGLALTAFLCSTTAATAALHDSGPMGAASVQTPDAGVKAKMRLPDLSTPLPLTASAAANATASLELRRTRFHEVWLQMQALATRIKALPPERSAKASAELNDLLDRYHLRKEADGMKLTGRERRRFKEALELLGSKL